MEPASPAEEAALWYQYYFHNERGRRGLTRNRKEIARLLWRMWSPNWAFDDATFDRTAASFDNPDFVDVVIHSYRHRYGLAPAPAILDTDEIEMGLAAEPRDRRSGHHHRRRRGRREPRHGASAKRFTGPHEHRVFEGAGHNLPQERPQDGRRRSSTRERWRTLRERKGLSAVNGREGGSALTIIRLIVAPSRSRRPAVEARRRSRPGTDHRRVRRRPQRHRDLLASGRGVRLRPLWTLLLTYPLMCAIQMISARHRPGDGQGHRRQPAAALFPACALRRWWACCSSPTSSTSAPTSARWARRLQLIRPGPQWLYVALFATLTVLLEVFVRYARYVSVLRG